MKMIKISVPISSQKKTLFLRPNIVDAFKMA